MAGDGLERLVSRAAAVRDRAGAGEVFFSTSTAELVRSDTHADVQLIDLGRDGDGSDDADGVFAAHGVNAPADPSRSPYPGLAPFGRDDADMFFGREEVVERCLELLRGERFVAVVGASGSGKSSVVLAGLAPRLPAVVVLRPGMSPQQSLVDAGIADQPDALLVVDQLEDVFTLCHSQPDRAAFLDAIVDHPGGLAVTVRADFVDEFAVFSEFAQLLSSCQIVLDRLDGDALTRAIEEPARRCGLALENDLAALAAAEIGDAPAALPMLGHALRETWLRRDGRSLTVAGYHDAGGVRSAISETAERVFGSLDTIQKDVARRLLLRMVQLRPTATSGGG